jgi:TRAP transporter TAXI family solute receptor
MKEFLGHHGLLALVGLLIVALCFALGYIVLPPPPGSLTLSTGVEGGAYALFGERYREILSREKVRLDLLASSGSVENMRRLSDRSIRVDAGFVQDGTGTRAEAKSLVSLGAICYTPLWVFYRSPGALEDLSGLKGKKIAIGAEGSGIRRFAKQLLRASDVADPPTRILDLQGAAANKALLKGEVDAVMILGTEDNSLVRELLYAPSIKLMSFRRAEAYVRLFPALSHVVLPAGILALSKKLPAEDVHLLAATTSLVVRKDLHPALIYLLLDAAVEIHSSAGWVNRRGEFPVAKELDFPSSTYADRFYKSGRPFLFDYLPFRVAIIIDRLAIVLLPLAFLFGPVIYVVTTIYGWRNRRKLYRWYRELKELEMQVAESPQPEECERLRTRLDRIEASINNIRVPLAFFPDVYRLKDDVNLVRGKLARCIPAGAAP